MSVSQIYQTIYGFSDQHKNCICMQMYFEDNLHSRYYSNIKWLLLRTILYDRKVSKIYCRSLLESKESSLERSLASSPIKMSRKRRSFFLIFLFLSLFYCSRFAHTTLNRISYHDSARSLLQRGLWIREDRNKERRREFRHLGVSPSRRASKAGAPLYMGWTTLCSNRLFLFLRSRFFYSLVRLFLLRPLLTSTPPN